jgi:hypothetical protein
LFIYLTTGTEETLLVDGNNDTGVSIINVLDGTEGVYEIDKQSIHINNGNITKTMQIRVERRRKKYIVSQL